MPLSLILVIDTFNVVSMMRPGVTGGPTFLSCASEAVSHLNFSILFNFVRLIEVSISTVDCVPPGEECRVVTDVTLVVVKVIVIVQLKRDQSEGAEREGIA